MHRRHDQLAKHPLNTTVSQLLNAIDRDIETTDPDIAAERASFIKVLHRLRDILDGLDPDLAPLDIMGQINNQLQNNSLISSVQSLSSGSDINQFIDLNTRIEPALSYIAQLRGGLIDVGVKRADIKSATDAFERYSKLIDKKRHEFETRANEAESKIIEAAGSTQAIQERVQAVSSEFDTQLSTWKSESSTHFENQKTQFAADLKKNRAEFEDLISNIKKSAIDDLKTLFDSEQEAAKQKQADITAKLEGIFSSAQDLHKKIKDHYNLVARDSIIGGHLQIANREQKAALIWRRVTVGSIILAFAWIFTSIFWLTPVFSPERAFWLQLGKSVSLTVLLISFAAYASKQAALHRVSERRARSFYLQVHAFDPFVEDMEPEDKLEMKKALSNRIFGPEHDQQDQAVFDNTALESVDRLVGVMERLVKLKIK